MKIANKQREILEESFNISEDENMIELESWTNGGVDMLISLDKRDYDDIIQALEDFVENFDIDGEIDLYRENKEYKEHFTIRESIEDFEDYIEIIKGVIRDLENINDDFNDEDTLDFNDEKLNTESLSCVAVKDTERGLKVILIGINNNKINEYEVSINIKNYDEIELYNLCKEIATKTKDRYYTKNGMLDLNEVKNIVKDIIVR